MILPAALLRKLSPDDQVKLDRAATLVEVATGVDFDALGIGSSSFELIHGSTRRQLATQAIYDQSVVLATGRFQRREALLARRDHDYALYVVADEGRRVVVARLSAQVPE